MTRSLRSGQRAGNAPDHLGARKADVPRPPRNETRNRTIAGRAPTFRARTFPSVTNFRFAQDCFAALDAETVANLVAESSDLAVVLDEGAVIRDICVPNRELAQKLGQPESWIGQNWVQLLHQGSRAKATLFLSDATAGRTGAWHHFNHPGRDGADLPLLYAASSLDANGRLLLFGRDLRPLSLLQQRLIDAQHKLERDHGRIRQLELRYRLMLQTSPDPLLVVNAATGRVLEGNAALSALVDSPAEALAGVALIDLFTAADHPRINAVLMATRNAAPHDAPLVSLLEGAAVTLTATLFHDDGAALLLVRLRPERETGSAHLGGAEQPALLRLIDQAPDAYVVTDEDGRIMSANAAFQTLVDITRPRDLIGQPLDRWLGRGSTDLGVLLANLRQRGSVRLFNSNLAGQSGISTAIEVSAVSLPVTADGAAFGFAIRDIERRVAEIRPGRDLPRSADQLTELIGRVPLKDLVREATDMIERLCIETALEMTHDNRASAAEMLGLSRQSLYVKLHRYGLGDLADVPG